MILLNSILLFVYFICIITLSNKHRFCKATSKWTFLIKGQISKFTPCPSFRHFKRYILIMGHMYTNFIITKPLKVRTIIIY